MPEIPDEIIVEQIRNGDKNAFSHLVLRYRQKVFQTCMGFVHHEEDANDLTQEIFIRAYQKLDSFKADAKFSTWLYRISVNMAINTLRKRKIVYLIQPRPNRNEEIQLSADSQADDKVINREEKMFVKQVLDSLTFAQRKVFVLSHYRDLSNQEVADVLQISVKAVESLLYRARVRMQQVFKEKTKDRM